MRGILAMLLVLVGGAATAQQSDLGLTVGKAIEMRDTPELTDERISLDVGIQGALYQLGWVNLHLREVRHQQAIYCPPKGLFLTSDEVISILKDAVARDPAVSVQPFGYALILQLERVFPCPRGK